MTTRNCKHRCVLAVLGALAVTVASLAPASVRAAGADGAANPVIAWDLHAQTAIWDVANQQPWVQSRSFAMVHGAIYDAVNAISGTPYEPYLIAPHATGHESLDAAVAAAAYQVLLALFPDQSATLREQYEAALAAVPESRGKRAAIAIGNQAAAAMIAAREDDGAFGSETWASGTLPGQWRPTPPTFAADGAWVGHVTPFAIPSASMFRTSGPPALTSSAYTEDFNEVKRVGAAASTERTQDQTDAANMWHDRHLVEWGIKREVATSQGLDALQAARMFAMVNLAAVDTAIACFNEKEAWSFWRPITAIQLADTDDNPATEADPNWMPLLVTPPFPDYTSGHACASGAIMGTLTFFFQRDDIAFSASSEATGITRHYSSFSQVVAEVINARVWGGIHFRTADVEGAKIGAAVSGYVTKHYLRPTRRRGHKACD